MTTEQLGYDKTSIASIFAYSQKLIGHSLRELVSEEEQYASNLQGQGKGGLGQMIEELFFHYPNPISESGITFEGLCMFNR